MKLGNPFRENWRGLGDWALTTLDNLISSLQGTWKKEHNDDDTHGHVHADSLQVGRISFSNILTPELIAASQVNNFNDSRLRDAGLVRFNSTLSEVGLTGIQVPQDELGNIIDARVLVIENVSTSMVLALEHENTNSSPANRFSLPSAPADVTGATNRYYCLPRSLTTIVYNSVIARWEVLSRSTEELMSYQEVGSNQNNYAPANFKAARVVRIVPTAANLTISGFDSTGLVAPVRKTLVNEGAYRIAVLHMNTASNAANRVQCPAGSMYYLHPRESADLYFETDGTWHIILKADQWVDVTYAAGNFTSDAGTWTVDSADQATYQYQIDGNKMTVAFEIGQTDIAGGPVELRIAVPAGRTIARNTRNMIMVLNAGVAGTGVCVAIAGNQFLSLYAAPAAPAWTNTAADDTAVLGQITFMVETSCATVSENHTDTAHGDTAHGDAGHSDTAHVDVAHVDSHSDTAHSDTAHGDTAHSDSHTDVAHSDTAHEDVTHVDGAHQDTAHTDDHTDVTHGDQHIDFTDGFGHADTHVDQAFFDSHGDVAHEDAAHGDTAHTDVAHSDVTHSDTHDDVAHSDGGHSDTPHADTHTDTAHSDTAHVDSAHTDTAHADTPHVDVGLHCDTGHSDV